MKPEFEKLTLKDNEAESRFEMKFERHDSFIEYEITGDVIALLHIEVDPSLEGRGAGTALVEKTLQVIEDRGLQVLPLCPFVSSYIKRHPDWNRIVAGQ